MINCFHEYRILTCANLFGNGFKSDILAVAVAVAHTHTYIGGHRCFYNKALHTAILNGIILYGIKGYLFWDINISYIFIFNNLFRMNVKQNERVIM